MLIAQYLLAHLPLLLKVRGNDTIHNRTNNRIIYRHITNVLCDSSKGEKMNRETIITAIVALVVAIFDLLKIFGIAVPIEDNTIYTIVSLIVAAVIYWRNQSWTVEGWTGTVIGREMKAKRGHEAETAEEPEDSEVV